MGLVRTLRQPVRSWRKYRFRQRYTSQISETDHCYISQNCVGGRLYELERRGYASPTVGAWFSSVDFLSFCEALEDNLSADMVEDAHASARVGYPVGRIGEILIWFQHYPTFDDAHAGMGQTRRACGSSEGICRHDRPRRV